MANQYRLADALRTNTRKRHRKSRLTRTVLGSFREVPAAAINSDTIIAYDLAEHAGTLARRYLPIHPGVNPVNYVIAATTQQLGAELWTT